MSDLIEPKSLDEFGSILPMIKRVATQTIGNNLVNVKPMNVTPKEVFDEVKAINRDRKIESITENIPFEEMKVEEHPDYNGPKGNLFYLDFVYGSHSNIK